MIIYWTQSRQVLLALFARHPEQWFTGAELRRMSSLGTGLYISLDRFSNDGLLARQRIGSSVRYQITEKGTLIAQARGIRIAVSSD